MLLLCVEKKKKSWITLENGKTTADAMGDVWRGLEVVEMASRVGSDMLVSWWYGVARFFSLYFVRSFDLRGGGARRADARSRVFGINM
jgi:hypothetical protein